jgi:hypothetical protein
MAAKHKAIVPLQLTWDDEEDALCWRLTHRQKENRHERFPDQQGYQRGANSLGQSRYRVDVHECSRFPGCLRYSAVESLSQPWRYDVAVTCSSADIACDCYC